MSVSEGGTGSQGDRTRETIEQQERLRIELRTAERELDDMALPIARRGSGRFERTLDPLPLGPPLPPRAAIPQQQEYETSGETEQRKATPR